MELRFCTACNTNRPLSEFYLRSNKSRSGRAYFQPYCKACSIERAVAWAAAHPESRKRSAHRAYLKRTPEQYARALESRKLAYRKYRANRTPEQKAADQARARHAQAVLVADPERHQRRNAYYRERALQEKRRIAAMEARLKELEGLMHDQPE